MKYFKLVGLIGLLTLFITGCSIDSQSPEQLIKDKPVYNEDKKIIYDGINQMLTRYTKLVVPLNSTERGSINEVDLNNDGKDEIVAFEKKENINEDKTEVGFIVLSKNNDGTYSDKGGVLQEGSSIEYANFYDLNNDGNLEIILLIKNQDKTNMYVYDYNEDTIKLRYKYNPTWISNKSKLTDMKVEIGFFNKDDILDVLILNYNPNINTLYASIMNFKDGIRLIDSTSIENVKSLSNLYTITGNISNDKRGIVLDIPMADDNTYITQILYMEDTKIKKAFKDNDEKYKKSYYMQSEDINNDNIIDIPIANGNKNTYSLKSSVNVNWYNWNDKNLPESDLVFNREIYYNYQYNFKILIPSQLVGKFYIDQEDNSDVSVFKCDYYDSSTSQIKNIFDIHVTPKNVVEDTKNISTTNAIIFGDSYDYTFTFYPNDTTLLEELNINNDTLRDYFSLIY